MKKKKTEIPTRTIGINYRPGGYGWGGGSEGYGEEKSRTRARSNDGNKSVPNVRINIHRRRRRGWNRVVHMTGRIKVDGSKNYCFELVIFGFNI